MWVKVSEEKYGGWRKERLLPAEGISGCFEEAAEGEEEGELWRQVMGRGGGVGAEEQSRESEASSGQQGSVP